jgi:hypothetical protein
LIDGHLSIESSTEPPDQGTTITLRVPLPPPSDYDVPPTPSIDHEEGSGNE